MKEPPKHRIEAIVDALLESDQMKSAARYLTSGRRFASLETEEIKTCWTQAARTFLISYGGASVVPSHSMPQRQTVSTK
jgi:hypothetical protein